jgi:hypothetical protein
VIYGDTRLPERFWDKVIPVPYTGCWLWVASLTHAGYGQFKLKGKSTKAHLLTSEILYGTKPFGLVTDHVCKERTCCNPDHLEYVTQKENVRRGKWGVSYTHCLFNHELSGLNLVPSSLKKGARACLTCSRIRARQRHAFITYERAGNVSN